MIFFSYSRENDLLENHERCECSHFFGRIFSALTEMSALRPETSVISTRFGLAYAIKVTALFLPGQIISHWG